VRTTPTVPIEPYEVPPMPKPVYGFAEYGLGFALLFLVGKQILSSFFKQTDRAEERIDLLIGQQHDLYEGLSKTLERNTQTTAELSLNISRLIDRIDRSHSERA